MQATLNSSDVAVASTVVVLATGGTIAGASSDPDDHVGYTAGQISVAQLLESLPTAPQFKLHSEQLAQLDSKDMDFAVWCTLAERCAYWLARDEVAGVVITHGTDTLEETAYFLQCVLAPTKPVVLACAMRPATAAEPDGPQNLTDALALASLPAAHGVLAVCAGVVHTAADVQKVHPSRLDAFDSGDAGPLGYLEEGVLRRLREWPALAASTAPVLAWPVAGKAWPRVEIVMNYAGASGELVDSLVRDGVAGLVAAGTGNGRLHYALEAALLRAQSAGVRVVRTSRCAFGHVVPHQSDVLPDAVDLSPVKARVRLMLELLR